MSRYTNTDVLLKAIRGLNISSATTKVRIINLIGKQPTVDIVHCRDCQHWGTGTFGETETVKCCEYGNYMVGANGYCVYGDDLDKVIEELEDDGK